MKKSDNKKEMKIIIEPEFEIVDDMEDIKEINEEIEKDKKEKENKKKRILGNIATVCTTVVIVSFIMIFILSGCKEEKHLTVIEEDNSVRFTETNPVPFFITIISTSSCQWILTALKSRGIVHRYVLYGKSIVV